MEVSLAIDFILLVDVTEKTYPKIRSAITCTYWFIFNPILHVYSYYLLLLFSEFVIRGDMYSLHIFG